MFGMYPFLLKLYADGGYQGPVFRRAVTKIMAQVNVEIVKRSDHAKGFVVLAKAMGGGTNIRMARPVQTARQGLGKSQSKGARVPASRLHQAHVEKTMQSRMISPDRLLTAANPASASTHMRLNRQAPGTRPAGQPRDDLSASFAHAEPENSA